MSMPSFPPNGANMTREQALTMIISSIAMEESALSRVLDAEADKLQYILDKCRDIPDCCGIPMELLEANRSVTRLLEAVAQNQMILRGKLALAVGAGGQRPPKPPCPPIPPCPPKPPSSGCPKSSHKRLPLEP